MKIKFLLSMAVMALCSDAAWATPITVTGSSTVNALIPDNNLNGISDTITLTGSGIQSVTDVQVSLNIRGDSTVIAPSPHLIRPSWRRLVEWSDGWICEAA